MAVSIRSLNKIFDKEESHTVKVVRRRNKIPKNFIILRINY